MIKSIHIKNVKGIQDKKFELNIYPNKPSILVAPNGFGKSSFAIAFEAITKNRNKMILEEEYYPINNSTPNFELIIEYKNKQEDKELENLVLKTDKKGAIRFKGWTTWNVETVQ